MTSRGGLALLLLIASAWAAHAQHQDQNQGQYRNFEITPDQRGGGHGTYGERNFEFDAAPTGQPSGRIGGRPIGRHDERPSPTPGNTGATQSRCYVDGQGGSVCR